MGSFNGRLEQGARIFLVRSRRFAPLSVVQRIPHRAIGRRPRYAHGYTQAADTFQRVVNILITFNRLGRKPFCPESALWEHSPVILSPLSTLSTKNCEKLIPFSAASNLLSPNAFASLPTLYTCDVDKFVHIPTFPVYALTQNQLMLVNSWIGQVEK